MVLGAGPGHGALHAVPEQVPTAQLDRMLKGRATGDSELRTTVPAGPGVCCITDYGARQESRAALTGTLGILRFLKITPCTQTVSTTGFEFNEAADGAWSWVPRPTRAHPVRKMAGWMVTGRGRQCPGCDGWPSALSLLRPSIILSGWLVDCQTKIIQRLWLQLRCCILGSNDC